MFDALHRIAVHRRTALLGVVIGLLVLGGYFGAALTGRLGAKLSDYSNPGSSSSQAREEILRATGIDVQQGYLVLVTTPPITVSSPPPAAVRTTVAVLRQRPEVREVTSYASAHEPRMIAEDGRTSYVVAQIAPVQEKKAVDALRAALAAQPSLHGKITLGGPTVADVQVTSVSSSDLAFSEMFGLAVLIVLLLFVFRGARAALLPLGGSVFTILVTLLGMSIVSLAVGLSVFALNLVIALGLGLSIDFSLLMVSRYREELAAGVQPAEAVRRTLHHTGRTICFSSLIVAGALASLFVFPERFLYSMAIAGILVTAAALVYAVAILPAILVWQGRRLAGRAQPAGPVQRGGWYRLAQWVTRRPIRLALIAGAVMIALGLPILGIRFTGVDATALPASTSSGAVARELQRDFPGAPVAPVQLVVSAPRSAGAAVAAYRARVGQVPGVVEVSTPARLDAAHWEVDAYLADQPLSASAQRSLHAIRQVPSGLEVRATGQTAEFRALQDNLASRLPWALTLVALWAFVVLFAMTGSLVLPIKALIMNALTLCAAFGILVLVFQHGWGSGALPGGRQVALESTSPLILFALAFGLSTDYGVFLLGRIKEAHDDGYDTADAVAVGLQRTGRVVTSAAVLFCVAVGALGLSRLSFVEQLGIGTAVAVLLDATVVRAILVPALMVLLGRANWWAPRRLRAVHRRLGLDRIVERGDPATNPAPPAAAATR